MAITNMNVIRRFIGLSSDTKPTIGVPYGSTFYEYNTGLTYITYDGTNWAILINPNMAGLATKTSTSHLTSAALFNWYGSVQILSIIGRVTTGTEAAANTCKLTMTADALAAVDLCATKDITTLAAGTKLHITGTFADAMIGATGVAVTIPQAAAIDATCVTSGTINVVYGSTGTTDGVIVWECLWRPTSITGRIIPA